MNVWCVIDGMKLVLIIGNFGDMCMMIMYLVIMMYGCIMLEVCVVVGIIEGLICLVVGFEYVGDICNDLVCGLDG